MKHKQVLSAMLVFSVASCGSDSAIDGDATTINQQLGALKTPQPTVKSGATSLGSPAGSQAPDPAGYYCELEEFAAAAVYDQHISLDPTSDIIYLGSMLDGGTLETGAYVPITAKRGSATFSLSHQTLQQTGSVNEIKLSTVREELKRVMNENNLGSSASHVSFEIKEVHSEEHLKIALGANASGSYSGFSGGLAGNFSFEKNEALSRHLVKFSQVYFSADLDVPAQPSDHFADGTKWDELKKEISNGVSPAFVSSVKYGRLVLFSVVSTESSVDVAEALNFFFSYSGVKVGVDQELKYKKVIANSRIKAMIYGGDAGAAAKGIWGADELKNFISNGGNFSKTSPGYPLSYTLRYVANNEVVKVAHTTNYLVRNCYLQPHKFKLDLDSIGLTKGSERLYGRISASAAYYDDQGKQIPGGTFADESLWSLEERGRRISAPDVWNNLDGSREFAFDSALSQNACVTVRAQVSFDCHGTLGLGECGDTHLDEQKLVICVDKDKNQWITGDGNFDIAFSKGNTEGFLRFRFFPMD